MPWRKLIDERGKVVMINCLRFGIKTHLCSYIWYLYGTFLGRGRIVVIFWHGDFQSGIHFPLALCSIR